MKLNEVLREITEYCRSQLVGNTLDYLINDRKVTRELIDEFEMGFFPLNGVCPVDKKWLEYHKIICRDTQGNTRCPFEGRVTFPIYNTAKELVSIQARLVPEIKDPTLERYNERKYWHSSFDKSRVLYNLHRAIPEIRKTGKVIITEGQFDVFAAHKFGIRNCICSSGTVLNRQHLGLISRYANDVLILYDNDTGGREAVEKLKKKNYVGLNIRFLTLPRDKEKIDLDIFLHTRGREALVRLVKKTDGLDSLLLDLQAI